MTAHDLRIDIPPNIKHALDSLKHAGYEAYIVGGCVRDSLLGIIPNDFDITTSALPCEIKRAFDGFRTIDTGMAYGTVTVIINETTIEITTFRTDGVYSDNRHPNSVAFTHSLYDDLSRRDFTVNALAYSETTGVIDRFEGIEDLNSCLIRCVGDPRKRFGEDALRIMRALRFSAQLGFDIESETLSAINELAGLLLNISAERIYNELIKLLTFDDAYRVLQLSPSVISVIIPEVDTTIAINSLGLLGSTDSLTRLAAIIGRSELCDPVLRRLKADNHTRLAVKALLKAAEDNIRSFRRCASSMTALEKCGLELPNAYFSASRLRLALNGEPAEFPAKEDVLAAKYLIDIYSPNKLRITGIDLISAGFAPGPELGRILSELHNMCVDGTLENDRNELLNAARKMTTNQ